MDADDVAHPRRRRARSSRRSTPTRRSPRWAPGSGSSRGARWRGGMARYAAWLNGLVTPGARGPRPARRGAARPPGLGHPPPRSLDGGGRLARRRLPGGLRPLAAPLRRRARGSPTSPRSCSTGASRPPGSPAPTAATRIARHVALKAAWLAAGPALRPARGGDLGRRRDRPGLRPRARGARRPRRASSSRWTGRRSAAPCAGRRSSPTRRWSGRAGCRCSSRSGRPGRASSSAPSSAAGASRRSATTAAWLR